MFCRLRLLHSASEDQHIRSVLRSHVITDVILPGSTARPGDDHHRSTSAVKTTCFLNMYREGMDKLAQRRDLTGLVGHQWTKLRE